MVSHQVFAVPFNDFSSIVECVTVKQANTNLGNFILFFTSKIQNTREKNALANLMLLKIVKHGLTNGTLKHAQISALS